MAQPNVTIEPEVVTFTDLKITACRIFVDGEPEIEKAPEAEKSPSKKLQPRRQAPNINVSKRHFNRFKPDPAVRRAAKVPGPGAYDPCYTRNAERISLGGEPRKTYTFARSLRSGLPGHHPERQPEPGTYSPRNVFQGEEVTQRRVTGGKIAWKSQPFVRLSAQAPTNEIIGEEAFWGPLAPTSDGFSNFRPLTASKTRERAVRAKPTMRPKSAPTRPRSAARADRPGPSPPGDDLETILAHRGRPRIGQVQIGQGQVARLAMHAMQNYDLGSAADLAEMNKQFAAFQVPRVRVWGLDELESQLETSRREANLYTVMK